MGCRINPSNPPILSKLSTKRQRPRPKTTVTFSSSSSSQSNQGAVSSTTPEARTQLLNSKRYSVNFRTLKACKLGISQYPDFEYNAEGGTGTGSGTKPTESSSNDEILVSFDLKTVYIPPLTSATTKFLGLPLPPFLKIDIVPELFLGRINKESGKVA